jgi:hypothetical protein
VTYIAANFPEHWNARYVDHLGTRPNFLDGAPGYRRLGPADVPELELQLRRDTAPQRFVVLSHSQERFAQLYRLVKPGSFTNLARALSASRDFKLVFHRGSAFVFLFTPPAGSSKA